MIKTFCDSCENEIVDKNNPGGPYLNRLSATVSGKVNSDCTLKVEVLTSKDGVSNKGDFCKYCILDALNTSDDRPRAI